MTTKRLQNAGYISKTDSILAVICIIPVWICRNYSYIVFMDIFKLSEHFLNQEAMVMPRIRQKENQYRNEDSRREVILWPEAGTSSTESIDRESKYVLSGNQKQII